MAGSPALQFIQSRGWDWKHATAPNIELETCPLCKKSGYGHCYMEIHGPADERKNRDGLFSCHKCGKSGNLYSLKQSLGIDAPIPGVESRKDWSASAAEAEPLPDIDACHQALLEDEAAMDYLINGRGFSPETIAERKIGIVPKRYFKETGEVKALVYPYLVNGNCVFVRFRTLPTMPLSDNKVPKAFSSPRGWDVPLYNQEVLRQGMTEVVMVEGEANAIAAMDHGIVNVCGVPGANTKKAEWIEVLDSLSLEKTYICYDKEKSKVGQRAAQALASRIGVERCWKITLPDFDVETDEGEKRKGKDLNEWFVWGGGTVEAFEELKKEAVQFDVDGVASSKDAVDEFEEMLLGNGIEPMYKSPWQDLNNIVGFDPGDVIDVLAPEKVGKTTFVLNMLEFIVNNYEESAAFICLEMTRAKMARKWISHLAQIADNIPKSAAEAEALKQAFLKAIPLVKDKAANREGDLLFCYPRYSSVDEIYQLMIQIIRRYGVKWIAIDNIQRLADTTPRGKKSRTEHLSEISKKLSQIAKDYDVQMIRILQPHRIEKGGMVSTDNVDGSSQIAKDCDCMITLHRDRADGVTSEMVKTLGHVESEVAFSPTMLVTVGLSRYSSGGYTTLVYDGARSTVNERDAVEKAKVQAAYQASTGWAAVEKATNMPVAQAEGGDDGDIQI